MEVNGSQSLVRNRDQFWWFGHTYHHQQPHLLNTTVLRESMLKNIEFARNYSIPIFDNGYSVSPHHSGIYPVHEPLYQTWKSVLNVSVTSTEEYPHIYPPHRRRGFIHRGIMVSECMCVCVCMCLKSIINIQYGNEKLTSTHTHTHTNTCTCKWQILLQPLAIMCT